jgi:hypothetical protein
MSRNPLIEAKGLEDGALYSSQAEAELAIREAFECGDLNFEDEVWLAAVEKSDLEGEERILWLVMRDAT